MQANHFSLRVQRLLLRALALGFAIAATSWLPAQTYVSTADGASPATAAPTRSPADENGATIKVNFPNTPIQGIIPVYTQLTGKKLILDSSLQGETLKIVGNRPLTKKEAITFIEASLLMNGYALIQVDDETSKLIHWSGSHPPNSEKLPVISSITDLPKEETIVHFVMPLQNISPEEATKAFTTVVKLHTYGAITAVNNTSNIIITENSATIRSIYELAQVIDVPPAEIANEIIELKRSDAEGIAEIIQGIYEEKEKSTPAPTSVHGANAPQPGTPGVPNAIAQAPNPGGSASTNPTAARVKVIPQRRTNSILVIARPVDITNIKSLVEKLDRDSAESNFLERKLKYLPVTEFLAVARDALSRNTDIDSDAGTSGGSGKSTGGAPKSHSKRHTTNTPSTDAMQASRGNNNQYGNQFGGNNGNNNNSTQHGSLDDPDDVGAPESVVVGRAHLIADTRSNTLIVNGSPEDLHVVDELLKRMDVRPQQIYISTIIGQLNLGDQFDYGIDWLRTLDDFTLRRNSDATSTGTGSGTGTGTGSTGTGTTSTSIALQAAGTPGLIELPFNREGLALDKFNLYGQIGTLGRYIHLLDGNKNFKVLSRPAIYLRNNEKGVLSSGQRIAVPVSTLSNVGYGGSGNQAAVSSSIDYRDVVLKLEVIPLINSDDEVTLKVNQVNDNVVGQQLIGGNNIPTIGTQELVTTVTVKDASTVVLGGLITEREQKTVSGIIGLRRIPIIGKLFSRNEITKGREELLIFIQPQIIKSTDPLDMPNTIESGRSKVIDAGLKFANDRPEVRRATLVPR